MLDWGGCYLDLIDLPKIKPYLETLLGNNYRLDHDYLKIDSEQSGKGLYSMAADKVQVAQQTLLGQQMGVNVITDIATVAFSMDSLR